MDRKQLLLQGNFIVIDLNKKSKFWDGTFHGRTDPAGPIGPHNPDDPWGELDG